MGVITDKDLSAKPDSTQWLSDSAAKGAGRFVARVSPSGGCQFYFRYTNSTGKREFLPLGVYDAKGTKGLTLKQARMQAGDYSRLYQSGIKDLIEHLTALRMAETAQIEARRVTAEAETARLAAEKAAEEAKLERLANRHTVESAFNYWMENKLALPYKPGDKTGGRKDGGAAVKRMFNVDVLPIIGRTPISELARGEIVAIIDTIKRRGSLGQARETYTALRQLCRYAFMREWIAADPMSSMDKSAHFGRKNERDRVLAEDEIRALASKAPSAGMLHTTEAAIWIALSTCCRIGELLAARWEHIDLEGGTWLLPDSKNGKPHTVFLSAFAIRHFQIVKAINGTKQWCYPNRDNTGPVCPKTITKQITDRQLAIGRKPMSNRSPYIDALKLTGGKWTPHDLRRTGATMMTALGVLPEVAERCLNHTEENRVKRIYQRHTYVNEMWEAWRLLGERLELLANSNAENVFSMATKKKPSSAATSA
jgi:integrase